MPVGSPVCGSRTMTPPGGSGVAAVIPACANAGEFTHRLCRSLLSRATGRSGAAASSSVFVGNVVSRQTLRSQPEPRSQWPGGVLAARWATMVATSSAERVALRAMRWRARAYFTKCTWLSAKAGSNVRPPRSMTCVCGPRRGVMSAARPTARMRLPVTATASARGRAASMV